MRLSSQESKAASQRRFTAAFIVALCLHIALVTYVHHKDHAASILARQKPVVLTPLSGAAIQKLKEKEVERAKLAAAQRKITEQKKAEEKKATPLNGQVVDIPPTPDSTAPENAKYLSEHNSRTERETRSRNAAADYKNVMNEPTVVKKTELQTPQPSTNPNVLEIGPDRPGEKKEKKQGQAAVHELPKQAQRDRLALRLSPDFGGVRNHDSSERIEGNSNRLKLRLGEEGENSEKGSAPSAGQSKIDLIPPIGVLARISGGPANDHLEGLEEGEGTFLNSREFKFASFFNRLKRGVSQHWRPAEELWRRDPTGNIYGYRTRTTVLNVTLHPDGSIKDIQVSRSSGVDFLDREAVQAFQRAEPFPNPPKGLADDKGIINFAFGFYIQPAGSGLPF